MFRCNSGLTAKSQRTLSDVAESERLQYRGDPDDNLANSTIYGLGAGILKRYFRDTKNAAM